MTYSGVWCKGALVSLDGCRDHHHHDEGHLSSKFPSLLTGLRHETSLPIRAGSRLIQPGA